MNKLIFAILVCLSGLSQAQVSLPFTIKSASNSNPVFAVNLTGTGAGVAGTIICQGILNTNVAVLAYVSSSVGASTSIPIYATDYVNIAGSFELY